MANSDVNKIRSPSDLFRENPQVEHVLFKQGRLLLDISTEKIPNTAWPDYARIRRLLEQTREKPYTEIHNHPMGSQELSQERDSLPSHGDLACFLRNDEMGRMVIYQHNPHTNITEGFFIFGKTSRTPKTGIKYSFYAKGCHTPKDADIKLAQENGELFDAFEGGPIYNCLNPYFQFVKNGRYIGDPMPHLTRAEYKHGILEGIAKEMSLRMHVVPAEGFCYAQGIGFLHRE